jgi:hypothetical protein
MYVNQCTTLKPHPQDLDPDPVRVFRQAITEPEFELRTRLDCLL